MRDSKGRFTMGHKSIAHRDPSTGCFVAVFTVVDNKEGTVEEKVDCILQKRGMVD